MTVRRYVSPAAFKQALEQRLRSSASTGGAFARRRQILVFHRFVARIAALFGDDATLKGGLVLELRVARARATKDVDLRLVSDPARLLERLQEAGRRDLLDFMTFELRRDEEHPTIENDGLPYGGWRFRAECRLAGQPYGLPFGVDIVLGEPLVDEPEIVVAADTLGFAGIAPPQIRVYPIETHLAEKLHAYTMPRLRPNSRIKDLPDMALLATVRRLQSARLRRALQQTFSCRRTHALPLQVPEPPAAWTEPFAAMADEEELAWPTLAELVAALRSFLDPVLANERDATWWPETWQWR